MNMQHGTSRTVDVSYIQITGYTHRDNNQPCEDVLYMKNTGQLIICAIADGQSNTRYGAQGGEMCLKAVADYLEQTGISNITDYPFPDELPYIIIRMLRKRLLVLANNENADFKEFASTLLVVAVDMVHNTYAVVHLGDGCVIDVTTENNVGLLSEPDNEMMNNRTWLTTSSNAIARFRIITGSLSNKKRLVLLSDGATCFCRGRNIPFQAKECISTGESEELLHQLADSDPKDDASCIIVDLCPFDEFAQGRINKEVCISQERNRTIEKELLRWLCYLVYLLLVCFHNDFCGWCTV